MFYVALYLMHSYKDAPPVIGSFTYAEVMAMSTFLVCLYKNFVNMVQLWKASKILVGVDLMERAEQRKELAYRRRRGS